MTEEEEIRYKKNMYNWWLNNVFGHQFITFKLPNCNLYFAVERYNKEQGEYVEFRQFGILRTLPVGFRVDSSWEQFNGLQLFGYVGGTNMPLFFDIAERKNCLRDKLNYSEEEIEKNVNRDWIQNWYNENDNHWHTRIKSL